MPHWCCNDPFHRGAAGAKDTPAINSVAYVASDRVQCDVEDMHRELGGVVGKSPEIRRPDLRVTLIREETDELIEAIEDGDLAGAIKEMCDVLCVVYGTAVDFGVDLRPFWNAVHASNMAKKDGPVREDGKHLKPEGWKPPDIAGILHKRLAAVAQRSTSEGRE